MRLRDFLILLVVCLVWALNVVVSKLVVTDLGTPPLFYAALRSLIVAIALLPWLRRPSVKWWRVALITFSVSGAGFALLFLGLRNATPSSAAIVSLTGAPLTVLFAIAILKERIRWRRMLGIGLTFVGVMIAIASPSGWQSSSGLIFVGASAAVGALGAVYIKTLDISPVSLQAWAGFYSTIFLFPLSFALEQGQLAAIQNASWGLGAALLFSAIVVSIIAHTVYFRLLQKHDANVIAPLTLMTPLFTIAAGAVVTNDPIGATLLVGATLAAAGVLVIVIRPSQTIFRPMLVRGRL